jgi:hypothetical protein
MFLAGSRYADVPTHRLTLPDGREVAYKGNRRIEPPAPVWLHAVAQSERPDHLAERYYADPERFWRICDCNGDFWPPELVAEPGRVVAIPPAVD